MKETMIRLQDFREVLKDIQIAARVQRGEIFDLDTVWESPEIILLKWSDESNPNGEGGFVYDGGGWGFAGFHLPTKTFHRYFEGDREHCLRVIEAQTVSKAEFAENQGKVWSWINAETGEKELLPIPYLPLNTPEEYAAGIEMLKQINAGAKKG
jgi:hypothetical protein